MYQLTQFNSKVFKLAKDLEVTILVKVLKNFDVIEIQDHKPF